jgi:hypothetical protein
MSAPRPRYRSTLEGLSATRAVFRMKNGRTAAMMTSTTPNVHTMVAPVGRSSTSDRYTPSADTTVPIVHPMARRRPIVSA